MHLFLERYDHGVAAKVISHERAEGDKINLLSVEFFY
jgi:hypothetical protein